MPATGSTSPWNSAEALFYPSPTRSASENRPLLRPRHHVVDGGPDLGIAQRRVPAFGRHRSRAPLYSIDGAGVESVHALGDMLGPLALVTQLRRAGYTGIVAGDAGGLVDLLTVAGRRRRGRRAVYRLPLRLGRSDLDLCDGLDTLGRIRTVAQQHGAIHPDPVGRAVVMTHKEEDKQHQHCADPENRPNVSRVALFSHG